MTNLDQLVAEMELSADIRRELAGELLLLRHLRGTCWRYRRRLPHQVQTALDRTRLRDVLRVIDELDPPPPADTTVRLI